MTAELDTLRARLTEAGQRWKAERIEHSARLAQARRMETEIEAARADAHASHAEVVAEVSALAHAAIDAGLSENETAALLGVSRARTLRRWLGK